VGPGQRQQHRDPAGQLHDRRRPDRRRPGGQRHSGHARRDHRPGRREDLCRAQPQGAEHRAGEALPDHAPEPGMTVPGRRGLQICLGLVWLLDAGLQFQPYMFGPFFVTQGIELSTAGSPGVVASSVSWAAQVMLRHIAVYNAVFATIQLLIAGGMFFRRTLKLALAGSVAWALFVWWFGESLGGIFAGASPLAGFPGGVILYALIAVLLWPAERAPSREPASPAASGPLGATGANILWLILWGSFSYSLLLADNRAPDAIGQLFSVTDGQPGWLVSVMNGLSSLAGPRGTEISVGLAVTCALVAIGVLAKPAVKPAVVMAAVLALYFWLAEGLGGIFTGQGTDPNTGLLLILLAACYWPRNPASHGVPVVSAAERSTRLHIRT